MIKIALKSMANKRFVCAENAGGEPLIANRDAIGEWEQFEVIVLEGSIPQPQPEPEPEPDDPLLGCGSEVRPDGESQEPLVRCLHSKIQPHGDVDKVFDATKRIAWALRGSGAGLLKKNQGQSNVSLWHGQYYGAAIVAWPDGRLTKTMTDVPNGQPAWNWLDPIDPKDVYVPAMDPNS